MEDSIPITAITICTVVLNREWIIDKMLVSLINQDFPKDRIFFVLIDGGSTDKTVEIAEKILRNSGIRYKIIVRPSNIGEARNLCIDEAEGDVVVFWDSDVIAPKSALKTLLNYFAKSNVHVLGSERRILKFKSVEDLEKELPNLMNQTIDVDRNHYLFKLVYVDIIEMNFTAIQKRILEELRFKPLPYAEDADFCMRALSKGYSVAMLRGIPVYDVKIPKLSYSDSFLYARLLDQIRFLKSLAYLSAIRRGLDGRWIRRCVSIREIPRIVIFERRYLVVRLGILLSILIGFLGLLRENPIGASLLSVPLIYTGLQAVRIGFKNALRRIISILAIGIPATFTEIYYLLHLWWKCSSLKS